MSLDNEISEEAGARTIKTIRELTFTIDAFLIHILSFFGILFSIIVILLCWL